MSLSNVLLDKIEYLYEEIKSVEDNTRASFPSSIDMHQESMDFSHLYDEFKLLLSNVLDVYKYVFKTSLSEKAKKVYYVAICEMIKQDFYRGMLITFRSVTDSNNINNARYYELLEILTKSQGLAVEVVNGRRQFEKAFILETGIPQNMTKHVMKMFKIYWRYFHEVPQNERKQLLFNYLQGNEFSKEYIIDYNEADLFEKYREEIQEYAEKVYSVICRLDDIFSVLDNYYSVEEQLREDSFVEDINQMLGYDITKVLRDSDIRNIFAAYLKVVTVSKFKKIIYNLPQNEAVLIPAGYSVSACRVINNISCGIYKIRGNSYEVVIDPTISLEDMIDMPCDKIHTLSLDYYCYISREYFDIEVDGKTVYPRELYYRGQSRYVWFGKVSAAGRVEICGQVLLSSQKTKLSGKIIKLYNYESKQSELVYYLQNVKVNEPTNPYGRLSYSVDQQEQKLICVGNNLGIYYRENLRIPIENGVNRIDILLNDRIIEKIEIKEEEMFLFDKWNGTRYFPGKKNDKHSGSMILFALSQFDEIDLNITNRYKCGNYHVVEFDVPYNTKKISIGEEIFSFDEIKTPYYFLRSETGSIDLVENISEVFIKFVNLKSDSVYWFEIENEAGTFRKLVESEESSLSDLFCGENVSVCGKWNCSLWEKQKKIKSDSFVLLPKIQYQQKDICVLEGKDIFLEVFANEECFIGSAGEYTNNTIINIGIANIDIENSQIIEKYISVNVYIDKWSVCKEFQISPSVWGIRVKKSGNSIWERIDTIDFNPEKVEQTCCAICATGSNIIFINGNQKTIHCGITKIPWHKYMSKYIRKNELIFTDDRAAYKQGFVCMPQFCVYDLSIKEDAILTVRYVGPISEILTIRYFVDGVLEKSFLRDTIKNTFLIHILLGKSKALVGKRIAVDIANSASIMPLPIVDDILVKEIKEEMPAVEPQLTHNKKRKTDRKITYSDLVDIDKVSEYIFMKRKNPSMLTVDVKSLVNRFWEVE